MDAEELKARAQAWAVDDPDPTTAAEVRALVEDNDLTALEDRFGTSLEFGTAGLRGVLGGGTNRMNRAVVRRTTVGLARYLKRHVPDVLQRGVVVGRDARRFSDAFAEEVAGVFAAEGLVAHVFPGVAPTPLTAFALKHLKAAAAVMVTASHNPPEYNGYKVYWGNGAQIIAPHDAGIAKSIDEVGPARSVAVLSQTEARARGLWLDVSSSVERAYLDAILALRPTKCTEGLSIVYTAMHGVGGRLAVQALAEAGFRMVTPVREQQEPDGAFPTVRFPNPEEPGAMNLAAGLAEDLRADVVLANDPDADRLAVMARDERGVLKLLSGNEVGVLLGYFLLTQQRVPNPMVVTTIVSSVQLGALAEAHGARCDETLTGFKWIANRAIEAEAQGRRFVMGYEEALGYTVGTVVRDKDGIGTALVVADMAAFCASRGLTLFGYLEHLQREHGLYVSRQFNATLPGATGASVIRTLMEAFRTAKLTQLGGLNVKWTSDYRDRVRRSSSEERPIELPGANVIAWEFENGSRVTLRPSGTEPKIKVYFEWRDLLAPNEALAAARARADGHLDALEQSFLSVAKSFGLPA
jgi:phosphomannomutase